MFHSSWEVFSLTNWTDINEEGNPKDYEKAILETSCQKKYIVYNDCFVYIFFLIALWELRIMKMCL